MMFGAVRRLLLAIALVLTGAFLLGAAPAQADPVSSEGYVPMPDGTQLHYALTLPSATGRFPTLFTYDNYRGGSEPSAYDPVSSYVADGYAVIGANLPGTGCSTGVGNWLDVDTWGRDGANLVEWAARQSWSNGHVGMFGASFSGFTQLGVAAFRPPHLDAISPFALDSDVYRDIAYPGGIYNFSWLTAYPAAVQPALMAPAYVDAAVNQNVSCGPLTPGETTNNVATNPENNVALVAPQHPFYDAFWRSADVAARVKNIDIPVFGCQAWQDGAVSSRSSELYLIDDLSRTNSWFEGNNGGHPVCGPPPGVLSKFLDHYVRGVDNGFEKTPRFIIGHEANGSTPTWYSFIDNWKAAVKPLTLYPHTGGVLNTSEPTGAEAADSYTYPTPSPADEAWQASYDAPDGSVSYTTPPLTHDADFFGPGSVDLQISSSVADDADVQATVTEVRPDGQEQYVQRGWLRLSQRKLDPARSTVLRPYQTHLASDAEKLISGHATDVRVEIFPFEHVFRAGSSIRITFDTPASNVYGFSGFAYLTHPTQLTIYHDPVHISRVVLPLIPGLAAKAPMPSCGSVTAEPCRSNMTTVPPGKLTLR